jgi:hypothetical protein
VGAPPPAHSSSQLRRDLCLPQPWRSISCTHSGVWMGVSWWSLSILKKLTLEKAESCTYLTPPEIFRARPLSPSRKREIQKQAPLIACGMAPEPRPGPRAQGGVPVLSYS